jgi:hypothetical protein
MAILGTPQAGPNPWNSLFLNFKKQSKRKDAASGYQYNIGITKDYKVIGGWSHTSKDEYDKQPKKPEMVKMRLYNNRMSEVPIGDVEQFLGFQNPIPLDYVPDEMAAYANKAFESESGRGRYYTVEGVGHISGIRYNPSYQVMEVTFKNNGAIVTFFRIPKELYGEFEHHATSGGMSLGFDGKPRHLLGIRFWDLVRIRGQRTGGKYQYVYASGGSFHGGASQDKWFDMATRQNTPQAQQPVDAQREATIVNTEQPTEAQARAVEDEKIEGLSSTKYTPKQMSNIKAMRDMLIDKYGVRSPAYREFTAALEQGMGALLLVKSRYKLYTGG